MSTVCEQQPSRELINKDGGRARNSPLLTAAALITLVLLDLTRAMFWIYFCPVSWSDTDQRWQNRTLLLMLLCCINVIYIGNTSGCEGYGWRGWLREEEKQHDTSVWHQFRIYFQEALVTSKPGPYVRCISYLQTVLYKKSDNVASVCLSPTC